MYNLALAQVYPKGTPTSIDTSIKKVSKREKEPPHEALSISLPLAWSKKRDASLRPFVLKYICINFVQLRLQLLASQSRTLLSM